MQTGTKARREVPCPGSPPIGAEKAHGGRLGSQGGEQAPRGGIAPASCPGGEGLWGPRCAGWWERLQWGARGRALGAQPTGTRPCEAACPHVPGAPWGLRVNRTRTRDSAAGGHGRAGGGQRAALEQRPHLGAMTPDLPPARLAWPPAQGTAGAADPRADLARLQGRCGDPRGGAGRPATHCSGGAGLSLPPTEPGLWTLLRVGGVLPNV